MRFLLTVLVLCLAQTWADIYVHMPRGSNNRLNEQSATRNNGNRLFDSQNNARGGYNVGDKSSNAAPASFEAYRNPSTALDSTTSDAQYQMFYYEGSVLPIEWTAQHACGGHEGSDPNKANCNIVLQYACETASNAPYPYNDASMKIPVLADGTNTNAPDVLTDASSDAKIQERIDGNNGNGRGRHESEAYYYECARRSRNLGLFIADQQQQNNIGTKAVNTRQNPGGTRRGLECPEERDYYPYWQPTPWRDIAYLTDAPEMFCKNGLLDTTKWPSLNNVNFSKCTDNDGYTGKPSTATNILSAITARDCNANTNSKWRTDFSWNLPAPECKQIGWSRANHLGNGRDVEPLGYNWTLPSIETLRQTGAKIWNDATYGTFAKCVLRVRYNISTDDYDPYNTDSDDNAVKVGNKFTKSPIWTDPAVDVGAEIQPLKLNLDTTQFGRTFQDRSHVFWIKQRPAAWTDKTIHNLSVRGKRCNIVQCYPAVEYDFKPSRLHVKPDDLIHIQWTGSNTHNNGADGGDGQTGDAGEGKTGTDRHNMVMMAQTPCPPGVSFCGDRAANIPLPLDKFEDNMFSRSKCYDFVRTTTTPSPLGSSWVDCAVTLATSGFYKSASAAAQNPRNLDVVLNTGYASFKGGVLMTFGEQYNGQGTLNTTTIYDYLCTRNNNFSNRSQKGAIVVDVSN